MAFGFRMEPDFYPLYHYQYRIIMIGDSTVGKSSLLRYFTEGRSAEIIDPTVGVDFYARMVEIKPNFRVKLQLWDTAGQEKFKYSSTEIQWRKLLFAGQSQGRTTGIPSA